MRSMPASVEAERAVLGAVLLDNAVLPQAAEALAVDDFYLDSNRKIYHAILTLAEANTPADLVTLSEALMAGEQIQQVGGASYVASLTDGMPRFANIEHYTKIVKDKALLRRTIHAANTIAERALDPEADAAAVLDAAQAAILGIGQARERGRLLHLAEIFKTDFETIEAIAGSGGDVAGLSTGFRHLDSMTQGLQPSDLIVIAARPSVGKSALAMDIARHAALRGGATVAIFSLEMSRRSVLVRMLCAEADVDAHRLRSGFASREDWARLAASLGRFAEAPLYLDDSSDPTVLEIRARSRRLQAEKGLGLVIVDYMQLMSGGGTSRTAGRGAREENRQQEISNISRGLKGLAKELGVPVIAISQLNRAPEERGGRPRLSDLRESGQIEQDADVVILLFREEMVKPTEENRGRAEVIVEKQRNGPRGVVELAWLDKYSSFRNMGEDSEDEERR